jgi:outer membrane murein-binding lipoprotein Lpp
VTSHPSVAGAAVLAGLLVAGGAYAARHDAGLGSALQASATARSKLEQELPLGRPRRVATHTLRWHPPHVPKIHVDPRPPAAGIGYAPTYVTAAPVATTAPVTRTSPIAPTTRTSPVGSDDEGSGGDD